MSGTALDVLRVLGGAVGLYFGAEWLVRGASGLARAFGVPPMIVGLTVVAYGTSAPELAVGIASALDGRGEMVVGNVVGSNLANIGVILGFTAFVARPAVASGLLRRELPAFAAAALAVPLVMYDGRVSRLEGLVLAALAVAYSVALLRSRPYDPTPALDAQGGPAKDEPAPPGGKARRVVLAAIGLGVLIASGDAFVDGATGLARSLGVGERVIALTVVAIGTSLPELAASLAASLRGHAALAIGNVLGSNIFNVFLVLGASAAARPVDVPFASVRGDVVVLIIATAVAAFFLRSARRLSRWEGALLLAGYAAFIIALARRT